MGFITLQNAKSEEIEQSQPNGEIVISKNSVLLNGVGTRALGNDRLDI